MKDLTPDRATLDPIEIASIDEIRSLQLDRLKWSVRHAYDNVPMYKQRFDEAGVHPDDLQSLADLSKFPSPTRATCATTIPSASSPCRVSRSCACTRPPAPPASRPSWVTPQAIFPTGPT